MQAARLHAACSWRESTFQGGVARPAAVMRSEATAARRAASAGSVRADAAVGGERYAARGVSASKEDVHNAIKDIDKGLFPQAFCKVGDWSSFLAEWRELTAISASSSASASAKLITSQHSD